MGCAQASSAFVVVGLKGLPGWFMATGCWVMPLSGWPTASFSSALSSELELELLLELELELELELLLALLPLVLATWVLSSLPGSLLLKGGREPSK